MSNEQVLKRQCKKVVLTDGVEYEIFPLTINELMGIWPALERMMNMQDSELSLKALEDIKVVAAAALGKSIPEGKDIGDLVDMASLQQIIPIVVGQMG